MKTIKVKSGQTLIDIALQEYGCTEGLVMLLDDNSLSMDSEAYPGQELFIRELPEITKDNKLIQQGLIEISVIPNSQILNPVPEPHYVQDGYVQDGYVE